MPHLTHAKVHFTAQGIAVAEAFDDVYCSDAGGLAETDYVFIQQNGLPQRWQTHVATAFHIIETGFGTGANFLLTWQRFCQFKQQYPNATCQRLYFSSIEKYPLTPADLEQALALHPQLQPYSAQLLQQYPLCVPGCHRLVFEQGSIILDLWLGDVSDILANLPAADAIYLDGFAPSKNPEMWQPDLFKALAALSHSDTRIATFTAAGVVKRGLQDAGFTVNKVKGFGRKREMITATMSTNSNQINHPISLNSLAKVADSNTTVTIIGGGIASLCTALALQQRNINVHLICADADVAMQASQNRQGVIYPNLPAQINENSKFQVQAFLYARQFYQRWQQSGIDFNIDFCGMLHLGTNERLQQRHAKFATLWPDTLVNNVDAQQASTLAGLELNHNAIYYPLAGWLSPQQFCQAALAYLQQQVNFSFSNNTLINTLKYQNQGWLIHGKTTKHETKYFSSDYVVLATGSKLNSFSATNSLPLQLIRGQVSHIQQPKMTTLKTVICHKGYITPQWQGLHSIGATFDREATNVETKASDDTENLQQIIDELVSPVWLEGAKVHSSAAAVRASLPDRWPIAAEVETRLFVLGGLGANGIMFSPILAEILACQICAEPLPLTSAQHRSLLANRFKDKK